MFRPFKKDEWFCAGFKPPDKVGMYRSVTWSIMSSQPKLWKCTSHWSHDSWDPTGQYWSMLRSASCAGYVPPGKEFLAECWGHSISDGWDRCFHGHRRCRQHHSWWCGALGTPRHGWGPGIHDISITEALFYIAMQPGRGLTHSDTNKIWNANLAHAKRYRLYNARCQLDQQSCEAISLFRQLAAFARKIHITI